MRDPDTITVERQRAAYDALGLDPAAFNWTRLIEIDPHEVRLTRYVVDEEGRRLLDESGAPYAESVTIPLGEPTPEGTEHA